MDGEQEDDATEVQQSSDRNLYQRITAIMQECGRIDKTGRMAQGGGNYAFIEGAVVMAILRPLFVKHGVALIPEITGCTMQTPAQTGGRLSIAQCPMRFTLINTDKPEERISAEWYGEGGDLGDKAINKAGTSGMKYWLLKLLMITDRDEPDPDGVDPGSGPARQGQRFPGGSPQGQQGPPQGGGYQGPPQGQQRPPQPATQAPAPRTAVQQAEGALTITQQQTDRLIKLSTATGRKPPEDMEKYTRDQAADTIRELVQTFNDQARGAAGRSG